LHPKIDIGDVLQIEMRQQLLRMSKPGFQRVQFVISNIKVSHEKLILPPAQLLQSVASDYEASGAKFLACFHLGEFFKQCIQIVLHLVIWDAAFSEWYDFVQKYVDAYKEG
jgi:hypothetical protein